ncbi:MAG: hypothetical protein ABSA70_09835 [Terriglobia bacterium]
MSPESQDTRTGRAPFVSLLYRVMFFLAALVVARFVLEVAGVPRVWTQYVSSMAGLFLAAIYVAAIAPLRGGIERFRQIFLPALVLSAWTAGWVILATLVSAVFRLERSHFAGPGDYGNWGHLGGHIVGHVVEIGVFFIIVVVLMAVIHFLWRWPLTVGPGAVLGALIIIRYWVEAMGVEPWRAAAWSSTLGVLLAAFYLGGMAPRLGETGGMRLLVHSLVIAYTWRVWVFLATFFSAVLPSYKTHFFDPSQGRVALRLLQFLAGGVLLEGLIAGIMVWLVARWIARATQPATT